MGYFIVLIKNVLNYLEYIYFPHVSNSSVLSTLKIWIPGSWMAALLTWELQEILLLSFSVVLCLTIVWNISIWGWRFKSIFSFLVHFPLFCLSSCLLPSNIVKKTILRAIPMAYFFYCSWRVLFISAVLQFHLLLCVVYMKEAIGKEVFCFCFCF